jgi:pimeloyl-ACP methyl ester carboxylesterase
VVAPDLLGPGASDRPRADYSVAAYANGMRDLLDVLDIERATIVGHSLGGGVAAQVCYQYPRRCERLVLVASGGVSRQVTPILRLASAPFAEVTLPMIKWPGSRLAGLAFLELNRLFGTDLGCDRDELVRVFDGLPDGAARFSFTRTLRSVVDWRGQVVTMLDRCYLADGLPTLLVWGDRDAIIPVDHGRMAHAAMPSSRLEIFEGAGHFPHHKDPERFERVLDEFVATSVPLEYDAERWKGRLRDGAPGGVRR